MDGTRSCPGTICIEPIEMSRSGTAGYDRQITIFSPEGRLYQVEYAFKAISNEGLVSFGVKGADCAVVISQRKVADKMFEADSVTRLFRITRHIGAVATGLIADARALISRARHEASDYAYKHAHPIPIDLLARRIANLNQLSTQEAGMRPMGVALTLIGIDEERSGPKVFKCDPAGFYTGYIATASGPKSVDLQNAFEKKLSQGTAAFLGDDVRHIGKNVEETLELAVGTLASVLSLEFKPADLEIGLVTRQEPEFRVLSADEIERLLTRMVEKE